MHNTTGLPWVSIILLNYNGYQDTIECLTSLFKLDYQSFSIIIVDNHSSDNSLDHIEQWLQNCDHRNSNFYSDRKVIDSFHNHETVSAGTEWPSPIQEGSFITTIQAGKNLGFAGGNNIGIKYAIHYFAPDFLWILNNDTVVAPDSLTQLVLEAQKDLSYGKKIGIWGSKLLYYHQPDIIQAIGGKLNLTYLTTSHLAEGLQDLPSSQPESPAQDYVVGASLFVSKKLIQEVGLLSEDYFLYFEELDWAKRGEKAGFRLGYVPTSKVYHKEGKSIGSSSAGKKKSDLADYHGLRSKIIFFRKFYPERKLQLYTVLMASVLLRLGRLQFKRAFRAISLIGLTK